MILGGGTEVEADRNRSRVQVVLVYAASDCSVINNN